MAAESVRKDASIAEDERTVSPNRRPLPDAICHLSPEELAALEKKLCRRLDQRLLPLIVLMYILNYLDRNNIAAARLAGLQDDLKLTSTEYQTSVSILFVGYLIMQVPSNLFLDKIGKPSLYLPGCMVVWGIISGATAGCESFGGLVACRFFLGFVEAAYFPGCLFYISSWYTRKEVGFRTAILYSGALISGAFSGLLTAGITDGMDGARGIRAWRWLFIIEGSITVVIALGAAFILPDFPKSTTWLSKEEKAMAMWRLEQDIGEKDWEGGKKENLLHGAKLAALDVKTYLLLAINFGMVAAGGVTNFFPTVVQTLGFNKIITLLLTAPPYVLAVLSIYTCARHADITGERCLHIVLPLCVAIAAFILAAATTTLAPRYVAMMLMVPGVYCGYVVSLAWISNTLPRPPAKRATALAAVNAIANSTSIWTPYLYGENDAPRFVVAMSVNCGMCALSIISSVILRWHLSVLNKQLDQGMAVKDVAAAVGDEAQRERIGLPVEGVEKGFRFLL